VRKSLLPQGVIVAVAGLILAAPRQAHAYVDPGSGAMIWQIAAATVVGSLFYVRRVVGWVKSRLSLSTPPTPTEAEAKASPQPTGNFR
jgi:hypothetical protein